jgi:dolichol kinase
MKKGILIFLASLLAILILVTTEAVVRTSNTVQEVKDGVASTVKKTVGKIEPLTDDEKRDLKDRALNKVRRFLDK